jgi:predicted signal transduction protein with EAL and GGDEF domain
LFDTIESEMRASRLPPGLLEFEITESAVMQDPERAMTTISRLRGLGVTFSLDDFGTGYSSLASLKNLPVQSLKIDQSFVRDMVTDDRDASIVRAAIELGHNFKMDIVAEGVESQNVRELLTGLECDYVQGFHLARPMPAPSFSIGTRSTPHTSNKQPQGGSDEDSLYATRATGRVLCVLLVWRCPMAACKPRRQPRSASRRHSLRVKRGRFNVSTPWSAR